MIKFTVQRSPQRLTDIMSKAAALSWCTDLIPKEFGIAMDCTMAKVNACIITKPEIRFGGGEYNPGFSGRWALADSHLGGFKPKGARLDPPCRGKTSRRASNVRPDPSVTGRGISKRLDLPAEAYYRVSGNTGMPMYNLLTP
jgi:hypothetical protein